MPRLLPALLLALAALGCRNADEPADPWTSEPIEPYDPLEYVDPFIGTGGLGGQTTGVGPHASMPFGMTLVGPDTRSADGGAPGFYHFGGYHYEDARIDGFAHTHSHGMGINDYGGVLVMPRDGWDPAWTVDKDRAAPFSHDREWASPGRYAVDLLDQDIGVDIIATERGAHHKYTFPAGASPVVLIDLGHVLGNVWIADATVDLDVASGRIEGTQRLMGGYSDRFGGARHHFAIQLDPAPIAAGAWSDPAAPEPGSTTASGSTAGGWLEFPAGTTEVHLRLGLSWVDVEGAAGNLAAELPDLDHDARRAEAEAAWTEKLERVRVRGGTEAQRRTFHTAHYHTMLMPSRQEDVDGRYRGMDQEVHTVDHPYYSDFSMWDTFRTAHPWYIVTDPRAQRDFAQSIVQMTRDGGSVPRWPLAHGYTGGMVGTPADQILGGTVLKGITDWDHAEALDAAIANSIGPQPSAGRAGVEGYVDRGWVAWEDTGTPASKTLEYAWSDFAVARWAEHQGRSADAALLDGLAGNWANTWDPQMGFFRGRSADGSFGAPIDDHAWEDDFVEGNAWHYLWYVPFDVDSMIAVQHGGDRQAFLDRLGTYWDEVYAEPDDLFPDDWYWHGNEPVLHYAALGSLAGEQALSAESARWLMANRYDDTPEGLDGNDDAGTLSAWFAFQAIGIYPIAGTDRYALTSPLFERVEIDRPDGTWVITARDVSPTGLYVKRAVAGGEALQHPWLTHEQLATGSLELTMSDRREDAMR